MKTKRNGVETGFTLIEVMVAVLLLLIVMAGFVPVFLSGLGQASSARYRSIATNLAQQRMEEIRKLDYRDIVEEVGNTQSLSALFGATATVRDAVFSISYDATTTTVGSGQLKKVTVTVGWNAPPPESPVVLETLIHQQFLGPRISQLDMTPTSLTDGIAPAAGTPFPTPFPVLGHSPVTMTFHIAKADWSLVYENLNDSLTRKTRPVYMRLAFFDDTRGTIPIGDATNGYKIDNTHVGLATGSDGLVNDVYFQYVVPFVLPPPTPPPVPDGYWELQASAYNELGEPGNQWLQRVRLEYASPSAPEPLTLEPQSDNRSIKLVWTPGLEGDRYYWVIQVKQRDRNLVDMTWPEWPESWVPLKGQSDLYGWDPKFRDYVDANVLPDPWGDPTTTPLHEFSYEVWAVDLAGNEGPPATAQILLPPASTTTTTPPPPTTIPPSTTIPPPTTYSISIRNSGGNGAQKYDIVIKNSQGTVVSSGVVNKNGTYSASGLVLTTFPSESFQLTATGQTDGRVVTRSFNLPGDSGSTLDPPLP